MLTRDASYINGQWLRVKDDVPIPVYSPYDGSVYGQFLPGGIEEINLAVEAASCAQKNWERTSIQARADILRQIAVHLEATIASNFTRQTQRYGSGRRMVTFGDLPIIEESSEIALVLFSFIRK